jgi:tripartite-type tricarboxylate transporter receptor subunit TctC
VRDRAQAESAADQEEGITMNRRLLVAAVIAAMPSFPAGAAQAPDPAADYPSRPLRIVVPAAPGGSTDQIGRILGQKFLESWGRPAVVDNRPGVGTNIGNEIVARSLPDGYTLLVATSSVAINLSLYPKQGYHPLRDLAPIALIADSPNVLLVHPSVPVRSVNELIAFAKAKPRQLNYSSSGAGSTNHLGMELLKTTAGVDFVHVPFKGGGPALAELLSGRVQLMFSVATSALPQVRAERLRAIGITGEKRLPSAPEIPTIAESIPGFDVSVWFGVLAAAGTPKPIVNKLNAELLRIIAMPDVRDRLAAVGTTTTGSSPEHFARYLASEVDKWARVVKAARATPD